MRLIDVHDGLRAGDPSFSQPIYASLFHDEGGETHSLVWTRPQRRDGT